MSCHNGILTETVIYDIKQCDKMSKDVPNGFEMWFIFNTTTKFLLSFLHFLKAKFFQVSTLTCQIIVQQILFFFGEKNTYTTLLGPTCLLISEIFPSKPDFHLHKWEKILPKQPHDRPTYIFLISEKSATYTTKWSYTIIWQVRVL